MRLRRALRKAVHERAIARLETYWNRPGPARMVFPVLPTGQGKSLCIMFGKERSGLPTGWHLVSINGRHWYGKFVKVALNVLKSAPTDAGTNQNLLSQELRTLFGGTVSHRPRVRLVREIGAAVWRVERV
jgi:hypothetical protein